MLPFVTILAALDDLRRNAPGQRGVRWKVEKPRPQAAKTPARKSEDRLEVFQKFIEKLPDDDDQDPRSE